MKIGFITINSEFDFYFPFPPGLYLPDAEVKELKFKRLTMYDVSYGTYPSAYDVNLLCINTKVYRYLYIDESLPPNFYFGLAHFINEWTDQEENHGKYLRFIDCMPYHFFMDGI